MVAEFCNKLIYNIKGGGIMGAYKLKFFKSYKSVLKRNYLLVYLIYFSFFLFNGPLEQIIPILFEQKGIGEEVYGIFLSLNNIIHIVLPSAVAYMAHRFDSFKIGIIAMAISLIGGCSVAFIDQNYFLVLFFLLLLISGRTIFNFSLGNSINYTFARENRGKYFALRDVFLFGSISIGLFLGGLYTAKYSVDSFYMVFSIGFIVPLFIIAYLSREIKLKKAEVEVNKDTANSNEEKSKIKIIKDIYKDKKVWAFTLIQIGTTFYATSMNFLPLLGTSLGISVSSIMGMFGAVTIVNSMVALILGHFSDMSGRKWLYVIDLAFDMIPAIVFAFTQNITLFVIGVVLTMVKDSLAPISFAYFYDCFSEEKGVIVMGVLSSIGNSLSFLAPILIGILWSISIKYVFLIGAMGSGLAALVAVFMLPNIK